MTFIERINKSAVDTGDGSPKIIGSDLVILEFKEFINRRVMDIEGEQAIAVDREVKRVLLKLKANLEKDAGNKLI